MPPTSSGTIQLLRLLRKIVCELNGRGAAMASPNLSSTPRANRMDGLLAWSGSGRRPSQPQIPRTTSDKLPSPIPDGANALGQADRPVRLPCDQAGTVPTSEPAPRRPASTLPAGLPEPEARWARCPASFTAPPAVGHGHLPQRPLPELPPSPCQRPRRRPEGVGTCCHHRTRPPERVVHADTVGPGSPE